MLDAGCGSGGVTEQLIELLPEGRVFAVDGSPAMVTAARERIGDSAATFFCQDLTELELPEPVDKIFSNATFHWVENHPRLFSRLFRVLRPGGRISAQCGGAGNVAEIVGALETVTAEEPFRERIGEVGVPWYFAGPDETEERLAAAGFDPVRCWLEDRLAEPEDPQRFLEAACLAPYRERLDQEDFRRFSNRLMAAMGEPGTFNYVRLNIEATKPKEEVTDE